MAGKRGLIMGVANNRSIAWGIAKAVAAQGAEVALTYQGDALKKRVEPLAAELGSKVVLPCDVTDKASVDALFAELGRSLGPPRLSRPRHRLFRQERARRPLRRHHRGQLHADHAHLLLLAHRARPARREADDRRRLHRDADLLRRREGDAALQRHGRRQGRARSLASAISPPTSARTPSASTPSRPGPIKTLAAAGISDFRYILKWNEYNSPLRRTVTIEEVGGAGVYLLSDLVAGVTGEIHHVDAGYHVQGMKNEDAPDISVVKNDP